jgi:two-component system OmpR family sensor kinase
MRPVRLRWLLTAFYLGTAVPLLLGVGFLFSREYQEQLSAVAAQAGLSSVALESELAEFREWLAVTTAGAVAVAFIAAWLAGRIVMRPLTGLIATARAVGQGNLHERAALPGVAEPLQLAVAFNSMLDRIQAAYDAQTRVANEMRRFVADASHELRSPLAVLSSSVSILPRALDRGDRGQADDVLSIMAREIEGISHLVADLLLLARMEQEGATSPTALSLDWIEPLPLLEEVYGRAQLLATGQELRLEWPRHPVPSIEADRDMLRRALNNVVENALRHTPPDRHVTVRVEPFVEGCRFVVDDEGDGIAADELPHVVDRFYRGDGVRTRDRPGSGLGLSIVRAIVAAHGGSLEIASGPGLGTTVVLGLPNNVQRTFSPLTGPTQRETVLFTVRQLPTSSS